MENYDIAKDKYVSIYMSMYLNVSFNYLSNINSKFVMRFDYHDNFFNRMRIFFISKRMRNLNHSFEI